MHRSLLVVAKRPAACQRLMLLLYDLELADLGSFRAVRRDLLQALDMREMTYGWPVEMIVKAARAHARIVERPVSYRPRLAGQSKVGGTVRGTILATYRILRTTFRYAIGGISSANTHEAGGRKQEAVEQHRSDG